MNILRFARGSASSILSLLKLCNIIRTYVLHPLFSYTRRSEGEAYTSFLTFDVTWNRRTLLS